MNKILIPTNNPIGSGTTQWAKGSDDIPDPIKNPEAYAEYLKAKKAAKSGGGFSWNNLVSNLGNIFNGIGSIVGNANSYSRSTTNTNINDTTGRLVYRNSTTITVIVLGGIAVLITLILVLGKK